MVSEGQRAVGQVAGVGAEPVASARECVSEVTGLWPKLLSSTRRALKHISLANESSDSSCQRDAGCSRSLLLTREHGVVVVLRNQVCEEVKPLTPIQSPEPFVDEE